MNGIPGYGRAENDRPDPEFIKNAETVTAAAAAAYQQAEMPAGIPDFTEEKERFRMKKVISIMLALMMIGAFACASSAEGASQAEGGERFVSDWAIPGGLVQIRQEEEGYRVAADIEKEDGTGAVWEYSCYYHGDTDSLVSASSSRTDYTIDPDSGEKVFGEEAYDDLDDETLCTEFTIDGDGFLIWKDGRGDAGAGLKFADIGLFDGMWRNAAEETEAEFIWNGLTEDELFYTVYITRGKTDGDHYTLFLMNGTYDPQTGKLTANGTGTVFTKNAEGEYDSGEDGENYDAVFSMTKDGKVLFETDNGIELEYDIMGHSEG